MVQIECLRCNVLNKIMFIGHSLTHVKGCLDIYIYVCTLYVNTKIRVGPDGNNFRVIRVIYACAVNANICEQSLARNHVRFEGVASNVVP